MLVKEAIIRHKKEKQIYQIYIKNFRSSRSNSAAFQLLKKNLNKARHQYKKQPKVVTVKLFKLNTVFYKGQINVSLYVHMDKPACGANLPL